jgi:hypothetical protein
MSGKRWKYGGQTACGLCGQDIEYEGRGKWHDRGGELVCHSFRDRQGELVEPPKGTKHKPHPNDTP